MGGTYKHGFAPMAFIVVPLALWWLTIVARLLVRLWSVGGKFACAFAPMFFNMAPLGHSTILVLCFNCQWKINFVMAHPKRLYKVELP